MKRLVVVTGYPHKLHKTHTETDVVINKLAFTMYNKCSHTYEAYLARTMLLATQHQKQFMQVLTSQSDIYNTTHTTHRSQGHSSHD